MLIGNLVDSELGVLVHCPLSPQCPAQEHSLSAQGERTGSHAPVCVSSPISQSGWLGKRGRECKGLSNEAPDPLDM